MPAPPANPANLAGRPLSHFGGNQRLAYGVQNPRSYSPHLIWSMWRDLPILYRLFFLILSVVSIYTLFAASVVAVRLLSLRSRPESADALFLGQSLAALRARCENMRQLISGTFYLFGFIFFLRLPFAFNTFGDSNIPGGTLILRNLVVYFAFAANVYFVFLVLHSVQWSVARLVRAHTLRLEAQETAELSASSSSPKNQRLNR
jgi:hypothetical protein